MRRIITYIALVCSVIIPSVAGAHGPNVQIFHPTFDGSGAFTVYDGKTRKSGQFNLGLLFDYARQPMETAAGSVIEGILTLDVYGGAAVTDWLEVGADLPFALMIESGPAAAGQVSRAGIHDFGFFAKAMALSQEKYPISLAFIPRIFVPTGEDNKFLGDRGGAYGLTIALDREWERVALMFNLGALFRPKESVFLNVRVRHELDFGLGTKVEIVPDRLQFKGEIAGSTKLSKFFSDQITTPVHIMGGLSANVKNVDFSMGGGFGITDAYGNPDWRVIFGLSYSPRMKSGSLIAATNCDEISLPAIYFRLNSDQLDGNGRRLLDEIVSVINACSSIKHITAVGYADSTGSPEYNLKLSRRRAKAVKEYLLLRGIVPEMVSADARGEIGSATEIEYETARHVVLEIND